MKDLKQSPLKNSGSCCVARSPENPLGLGNVRFSSHIRKAVPWRGIRLVLDLSHRTLSWKSELQDVHVCVLWFMCRPWAGSSHIAPLKPPHPQLPISGSGQQQWGDREVASLPPPAPRPSLPPPATLGYVRHVLTLLLGPPDAGGG